MLHTSKLVEFNDQINKHSCHAQDKQTGSLRDMEIGMKLREFRDAAGMSQGELALASGVSQQLISQIENNKNASTKHLHKLARALGRKLTDFDASLTDVLPGSDFAQRYERLDADGQLALQALLDRLERGKTSGP